MFSQLLGIYFPMASAHQPLPGSCESNDQIMPIGEIWFAIFYETLRRYFKESLDDWDIGDAVRLRISGSSQLEGPEFRSGLVC